MGSKTDQREVGYPVIYPNILIVGVSKIDSGTWRPQIRLFATAQSLSGVKRKIDS